MSRFKLTRKIHYRSSGVQWRGISLTKADILFLTHLEKGYANIDITKKIGVNVASLSRRCRSIIKKLGFESRSQLVSTLIEDKFSVNVKFYEKEAKKLPLQTYRKDTDE